MKVSIAPRCCDRSTSLAKHRGQRFSRSGAVRIRAFAARLGTIVMRGTFRVDGRSLAVGRDYGQKSHIVQWLRHTPHIVFQADEDLGAKAVTLSDGAA